MLRMLERSEIAVRAVSQSLVASCSTVWLSLDSSLTPSTPMNAVINNNRANPAMRRVRTLKLDIFISIFPMQLATMNRDVVPEPVNVK